MTERYNVLNNKVWKAVSCFTRIPLGDCKGLPGCFMKYAILKQTLLTDVCLFSFIPNK